MPCGSNPNGRREADGQDEWQRRLPDAGSTSPSRTVTLVVLRIVLYGGLWGVLAFAVGKPLWSTGGLGGSVRAAFVVGGLLGLLLSPLGVWMLRNHDSRVVAPILLWTCGAAVVAVAGVVPEDRFVYVIALSGLAFVGTCCLIRWRTARVWNEPGRCRRCGYDLRGSLESKRCPECGLGLDEDTLPAIFRNVAESRGSTGLFARLRVFALRWPVVPVVVVIAAIIAPRALADVRRESRRDRISSAIDAAFDSTQPFDLAEAAPFGWTQVHVFDPYVDCKTVQARIGFDWPNCARQLPPMREGVVFVFERDRRVIEWIAQPSWRVVRFGRVGDEPQHRAIPRGRARFLPSEAVEGNVNVYRLIPIADDTP